MFELTRAAINKTLNDFKRITYWWSFLSQLFGIAYLAYAVFTGQGYLLANILLLVISLGFFLFFACATKFGKNPDGKAQTRKKLGNLLKFPRRIIKLVTLAITVYGVFAITKQPDAISILLLAVSLVGFILQIIFDTVIFIVDKYKAMYETAFQTDMENLKKPVTATKNFFKKLTGQEVTAPAPKTEREQKTIDLLQGISEKSKEDKKALKQAKKAEKAAKKALLKQQKIQAKREKRLQVLPTAEAEAAASEEE